METANIFQLLGTTGSLIMCASSVPQIIKTYRMKRIDGLSGSYLAILMLGMSFILAYALYVKNIVFIFGNGLSLTLTGLLVVLWFRYRKVRGKHDQEERKTSPDKSPEMALTFAALDAADCITTKRILNTGGEELTPMTDFLIRKISAPRKEKQNSTVFNKGKVK